MAHQVEVTITDELEREVVIVPKIEGTLDEGTEVVVTGNSRLHEGSLLYRLNPTIPGAG